MLSQITPDGTNAWTYDADGRKTSETLTGDLRTFTYDEDGDMLTAGNVEGSYTFTYDNDNRVIGVSEPFGVSLTYGLDADGDQTTVTDSFGGSETSTYDADGEVLSRSYSGESQALTMNFTYTALGQVATETDIGSSGTIATTSTTYDADSEITGVTTTNSGGTINAFSYVYDPAGNETSETDNGVTTTYTYDAAGQLTGANSTTYSYDSDGNDDNSGDSDGTDNELLSDGTYNYTYDSAGNEVSKTNIATGDVWTYYYNSQNAMTQALETTSPGTGGVMEQDIFYRYDAFGNMIQKEVVTGGTSGTDTITDYAVDGWNPALAGATGNSNFNTWAILNVSGSSTSLQTRNLFGDQVDEIIARIDQAGASDSAGVYWDLTDKLGSVRTVLNGGGTVVDTINYDAYGNTTSETNAADQGMYGWTGQEKDLETGLQYNNARWYDSSTGRWISQDPLGFDAGDSNLYRYVMNRPTNATDPSGLQWVNGVWTGAGPAPQGGPPLGDFGPLQPLKETGKFIGKVERGFAADLIIPQTYRILPPGNTNAIGIIDTTKGRLGPGGVPRGDWVVRIDAPHGGAPYPHINTNPKITGFPDPHTPISGATLKAAKGVGYTLTFAQKIAKPVAIGADVIRLGEAFADDNFSFGKVTIKTSAQIGTGWAVSLGGAWCGAKAGAGIGFLLGGPVGGAVSGLIGGIAGGIIGSFAGEYIGGEAADLMLMPGPQLNQPQIPRLK